MDIKKIIFGDQVSGAETIAPANDDLQGSLPIADIKYGVVRTRDGGYAALFEVLPTNYFLQSTAERMRIISNLAAWLRIAPDNLQILCLSQPVDVEQYTRRMEGFLQSEGDALCRTCIEDNINEVNQLVRYGAFTTRFYIAYRYEPSMVSGEVSYAKIAAALRQVMDSSVGYLARCGLTVVNPGYIDNHLVQTVFGMLGVDIIASKREHDLITTDHSDLARMRDRRNYEKMRQQSAAAWEQEEDYDESAQ